MTDRANWCGPWLVAAWPGMGAVAQIAAMHLATRLGMQPVDEFVAAPAAEPSSIRIENGLVLPARAGRCVLHGWRDPAARHDLLVMLAGQQPLVGLSGHAHALLDRARTHGVERVVTFAAMATAIHPAAEPRALAIATSASLLAEACAAGAVSLPAGEVGGMNGLLLGFANEHGMQGLGLLGEMPFYASGLPNPKAAAAVLRVFGQVAGIALDLAPLHEQARRSEQALLQHSRDDPAAPAPGPASGGPAVAPAVRERIEQLFAMASGDRQKALELKAELDRHGLFRVYEDRFLDLFRQGS